MAHAFYLHRLAITEALRRLVAKPVATLFSTLVLAIALALPAAAYVSIDNLAHLARGISGQPEVSVFLKTGVSTAQAKALEGKLRKDARIASLKYVSRDEALKQLASDGAFADLATVLPENPLPDAFVIEPVGSHPAAFEGLKATLSALPEVAHVQLDSAWVERLHALLEVGRGASLALACLLGTALVIVTFNTIRLQILTQRHEISVSLLLGATREFVRRPFLYFGMLQGFLGGVIAWAIVALLMRLAAPSVGALAATYNIAFNLHGPSLTHTAALLSFAIFLGWSGAALSVRQHLHDGAVD